MPEDIERLLKLENRLTIIETIQGSQGGDIQNIKVTHADMYKKINWANSKINMALGAIAMVSFIATALALLGAIK